MHTKRELLAEVEAIVSNNKHLSNTELSALELLNAELKSIMIKESNMPRGWFGHGQTNFTEYGKLIGEDITIEKLLKKIKKAPYDGEGYIVIKDGEARLMAPENNVGATAAFMYRQVPGKADATTAKEVTKPEKKATKKAKSKYEFDQIMEMSRKELLAVIAEEELDIKGTKKLDDGELASAVVDALGLENPDADSTEEDTITEDEIRAMDQDELEKLIKSEKLKVNVDKYEYLEDLADAVIEAMSE